MIQTFPYYQAHMAARLVRTHVCGTCWGTLVAHYSADARETTVQCAKDDEACDKNGFVSRAYVDRRRSEDHVDNLDARQNLPFLRPEGPQDVASIISEMFKD